METRLIKKDALALIVKKMAADVRVYAPVKEGDNVFFTFLAQGDEPLTRFANTKNAPKNLFFPHTEKMMRYTRTTRGVEFTGVRSKAKEAVLFGARPCDARSFTLLDRLFDQEQCQDLFYIEKRARTTVIALNCVHPPYTTCFCTSVGGNPFSTEGVDVAITEMNGEYLIEFLTPKGENLMKYFGEAKADKKTAAAKQAAVKKAAGEITSTIPATAIKPILDVNFEHPFWNTIHQRCLACGTCTFLCPTCHCFDISDETRGDGGVRIRNWDSCMFPMFTKETSGHNPRPSQKERWRQRVMHKFKYYVDNFGAIACVGCGRCVMSCPVNIDIRKIVEDIAKL